MSISEWREEHGRASAAIMLTTVAPLLLAGILLGLASGLVLALPGFLLTTLAAVVHRLGAPAEGES